MGKSVLDRGTRFQRQTDGRGKTLAYTKDQISDKNPVNVMGPWGGYAPDLTDDMASPAYAEYCEGIIDRDGDLVNMPGFSRIQNSTTPDLPLGGVTLPAATADAEPVVGIFQTAKRSGSSYRIAVTAKEPVAGTEGHVYAWDGVDWTLVDPAVSNHTSAYIAATANLTDFGYFPWGSSTYTGTGGQIFFCDGIPTDANNRIFGYPNDAGEYFILPITNVNGSSLVNAVSISNYFSRLCLFNTWETGSAVNFPHRFRWFSPATLDGSLAGAGYIDVDECEGPGLRCLTIADNNALYFGRGVAFVSRSGSFAAPFRVDYVTKQRGIIGKKAVCSIGAGSHFGIYTDGWLVMDSSGQFTELGVSRKEGSGITHKWLNTFYDDLSVTYADRTVCGFDNDNHIIIIAYCSKSNTQGYPDKTLYYDIKNDSLWPDSLGIKTPTAVGEFDSSIDDISWDEATGTWDAATRAWDIDISSGRYQFVHGNYGGLVFGHSRSINTKDGSNFTARFRSKKSKGLSFDSLNIFDKLAVEYQRVGNDGLVMDLTMYMDDKSLNRSINLNKGSSQTNQVDFMTGRLSGRRFGWEISGVAPVRVKGVQMDIFIEGDDIIEHG